jgi:hypothetical protein
MLEEKVKTLNSGMSKNNALSFKEFEERYNSRTLGKLYLPNGACNLEGTIESLKLDLTHEEKTHLRVDLSALYDVLTGKNTGYFDVSSDEFLGLIIYGDSIKFPGYKVLKKNNVGFLSSLFHHNDEEKIIPLRPTYVKCLAILRDRIMRESSEGGENVVAIHAHHDSIPEKKLIDGKIKITYTSLDEVKDGLKFQDPELMKIFERGMPLINGSGIFSNLYNVYNLEPTNPRKMVWEKTDKDLLNCYVK